MKRCGDIGIMLFSLNGRENAREKNVLFFKPVVLLFIIHIHVFRNKGLVTFITNVDRILTEIFSDLLYLKNIYTHQQKHLQLKPRKKVFNFTLSKYRCSSKLLLKMDEGETMSLTKSTLN